MRGADTFIKSLFTMRHLDDFVPENHSPRPIRAMVNSALVKMDALLSEMYEADIKSGHPCIAPRSYCAPCSCKSFSASARSANSWSKPNTTSFFAASRQINVNH